MNDVKTDNGASVAVLDRIAMQPPKMWNVILYNDDKTTMEFVVLVLMQIFHKSFEEASDIMMNIHDTGKGIAGTYSNEVATQKKEEAIAAARTNGFPLRVEIESVD
jgi:ATP-dependent Clp protease adaptor protein ClpS